MLHIPLNPDTSMRAPDRQAVAWCLHTPAAKRRFQAFSSLDHASQGENHARRSWSCSFRSTLANRRPKRLVSEFHDSPRAGGIGSPDALGVLGAPPGGGQGDHLHPVLLSRLDVISAQGTPQRNTTRRQTTSEQHTTQQHSTAAHRKPPHRTSPLDVSSVHSATSHNSTSAHDTALHGTSRRQNNSRQRTPNRHTTRRQDTSAHHRSSLDARPPHISARHATPRRHPRSCHTSAPQPSTPAQLSPRHYITRRHISTPHDTTEHNSASTQTKTGRVRTGLDVRPRQDNSVLAYALGRMPSGSMIGGTSILAL